MRVGRLRWWWMQRTDVVLVPTEGHDVLDRCLLRLQPTPVVPLIESHGPATASFHDVYGGEQIGTALLLGVRADGWARYKCSVPLRGRFASGDWRNRGKGLELAAIALRDPSRAYSARDLIAEPR